ncbi:MAG TPA: cytochrome c biogenesis protein CcsA [Rectinemataceae bacterium]|nr:cytochrome c biogenesis protein CcsA [Rectinemataceae bacterium]
MSILPSLAFVLILASALVQVVFLFGRGRTADPVSHWLLAAAAAILAALIAARSASIGFPALTGTFESLVFYALTVCVLAAAYRLQGRLVFMPFVQFGATIAAAALLAVASSPIAPRQMLAPIPALRSFWLVAHVAFSFVGESFFVVSFVSALALLLSRDEERRRAYDRITYTSIAVGYPIFTTGALIFGAIWAEQAWGSWWSWDPKETWALVTWLVYTVYLHVRFVGKWGGSGRRTLPAAVAAAAFLCTLFTFFGVNFLLPGLHSYA